MDTFSLIARHIEDRFYQNVAWGAIGLAIFVGSFVAQWLVKVLLLPLLSCCKPRKRAEDHGNHYPAPVSGHASTFTTVVDTVKPQQQYHYTGHQKRGATWHGHKRRTYESWVFLTVLVLRVLIVTGGVFFAFHVAGVNFFSLAVSMGVISLTFTYGAGSLISNTFAALYIQGSGMIRVGDFIRVGTHFGEVAELGVQSFKLINRFDPRMGTQIHSIPNKIPIGTIFTIFPDGPPPFLYETREKGTSGHDKRN